MSQDKSTAQEQSPPSGPRKPHIFRRFWLWLRGVNLKRLNKRLFYIYYILMVLALSTLATLLIYYLIQDYVDTYFWVFLLGVFIGVITLLRIISFLMIKYLPPLFKKRRAKKEQKE